MTIDEARNYLYSSGMSDEQMRTVERGFVCGILQEIRAEIEKAIWEDVVVSLDGTDETRIPRLDPDEVLEIIDKYKGESEEV